MCQSACACNQPALFLVPGVRWGKSRKHYHVILLLNKDTWCSLGDFSEPSSLATMIQQAWCSALHLESWQGDGLVHFSRRTPFRKPTSSDARPSSDDTLCLVDVLIPGRLQTKSRVKPRFSGSSVVMWKRCRKPGTEPVIS